MREEADVVLYLVNASENLMRRAPWWSLEMEILSWLTKPVVVLLNQTGIPRPPEEDAAELQVWRDHLGRIGIVKGILNLDGFTRCWVQEGELMEHDPLRAAC